MTIEYTRVFSNSDECKDAKGNCIFDQVISEMLNEGWQLEGNLIAIQHISASKNGAQQLSDIHTRNTYVQALTKETN
jgi:hypothetical protein